MAVRFALLPKPKLPKILCSVECNNSLRKRCINWIKIPPYALSHGGALESMAKLFKTTLYKVMDNARRLPTVIEMQTFTVEAVRIVNDRPLTTPSDHSNDLLLITPSCFLGQKLAPCNPLGETSTHIVTYKIWTAKYLLKIFAIN